MSSSTTTAMASDAADVVRRPCACGGRMVPSLRYEADFTLTAWCCFGCGAESPPKYDRDFDGRNGDVWSAAARCETCGAKYGVDQHTSYAQRARFCSRLCASPRRRR
jgi:hypothetical protein